MKRLTMLVLVGMMLATAACGRDAADYGESADAAAATRTVDVTITQAKQYQPPALTVAPGEVVTFKVTNASTELHEFMLGDDKVHEEHEGMMADMGTASMKVADRPNLVDLDPGQTKQLTWKFPGKKGATVIYGSHVPNDYTGGLKGTITVAG